MTGSEDTSDARPQLRFRSLWAVAICLLVGILVNVGVTWALAYTLRPKPPLRSFQYRGQVHYGWWVDCQSAPGVIQITTILSAPPAGAEAEAARWAEPWTLPNQEKPPAWSITRRCTAYEACATLGLTNFTSIQEFAHGWPFPCMTSSWVAGQSAMPNFPAAATVQGIRTNRMGPFGEPVLLPLQPLPLPFAVNAVIYATVPLGLVGVWRLLKRRLHPDRCEKCGYDLTGLRGPVCPECGTPDQRHPAAAT